MYYQAKAELEEHVLQAGEQAVFEANCGEFHEELVRMLGRLRYRTSYGQNVLKHTLEVVHLSGIMAAELKAGVKTTKRAALLHDIGKAVSHEVDGSHALISAQLARRCGESEGVVHAIEAHHYEVQPQTVEAVLLIAADAISASRPGARGESLENYIRRLEALEEIATAKTGVAKAYALQAGTRDPRHRRADGGRRRRRRAPLARDRPRDRGSARVPGPGQGDRHPREPRDRGGEVDTRAAARRWATVWAEAWPAADVDAIAALYAAGRDVLLAPVPRARRARPSTCVGVRRPGRRPSAGSASRSSTADRAAVDWWAVVTSKDGSVQSLAGTSLLRFDDDGLGRGAARRLGRGSTGATSSRTGRRSPTGYPSRAMRRYHVTTFGCQMNAHDSERIKGMLESLGLGEAAAPDDADVVVFNTCTIREKPDTRLAAYLGNAGAMKRERPDLVVAVGGCYAEAQRERIFELYPFVDVAFGPARSRTSATGSPRAATRSTAGRFGTHEHFAADLPMRGERRFQAWVQVSMGCNSACAYCIVPAVRGREQSRRPGEIVAEVTRLATPASARSRSSGRT